jgi:glycosyltransferase involved in cell wall biosynthesis
VLSNAGWFDARRLGGRATDVRRIAVTDFLRTLGNAVLARPFDVVVINNEARQLLAFCLLKLLVPWAQWQIVSVDLVVQRPRNWRQRIRLRVARLLFRQVELLLFFFKDTRELEKVYGIDRRKIRYIPFKINSYDRVLSHPVSDEGFILSCGQSKRDYATLCRAMEGLPYTAYILAPQPQAARKHGTTFDFQSFPSNVRWVTDDGSDASWIDWIARSRCLVLPILPDTLAASGISTYLLAMALGKCVVITDSPATTRLVDSGEAVIVPPANPDALRTALAKVMEDFEYRERVAAAGHAYAIELKDENRLAADITAEVQRMLAGCRDLIAESHTANSGVRQELTTPAASHAEPSEAEELTSGRSVANHHF